MHASTGAWSRQSRSVNLSGRSRGILRRRVILVAHHAAIIRNRVAITMGAEGNLVLCASDGHEALEVSHQRDGTIDLAITDVTMPELSGSDLCSRLLRERPGIRILVMSGTDVPELAGPEDSLPPPPSPFDGQLLSAKVRTILAAPRVSLPYVYMIFFGVCESLPAAPRAPEEGATGSAVLSVSQAEPGRRLYRERP